VSAKPDLRDLFRNKPEVPAHLPEQVDIAAPVPSKGKVLAQMHFFGMQTVVNDLGNKILGWLPGKIAVKLDNDRLFDPEHLKICQPLVKCLEQRRGRFRVQDRPWVRVKRDRRRGRIDRISPLDHRLHYPLVPQMQPVKNAQRQDGGLLNIRVLCAVKYLHL
jgi:hypothetical protein